MKMFVEVQQHAWTLEVVTITVQIPETYNTIECRGDRVYIDGKSYFKCSTEIRRLSHEVKTPEGKIRQIQVFPNPPGGMQL